MIRPSELNDLLGHTSRDMVERLRRVSFLEHGYASKAAADAADEIVRLRASEISLLSVLHRTLGRLVEAERLLGICITGADFDYDEDAKAVYAFLAKDKADA